MLYLPYLPLPSLVLTLPLAPVYKDTEPIGQAKAHFILQTLEKGKAVMEVLQLVAGISGLTIELLENYLLQNGWTKGTTPNLNAIVYEGPLWDNQGRPLTVILPARRSQPDANRRLNEVIRTVAAIESKSPESLVQAIARPRVRRRLVKAKTHFKAVPLHHPRKQVNSEV